MMATSNAYAPPQPHGLAVPAPPHTSHHQYVNAHQHGSSFGHHHRGSSASASSSSSTSSGAAHYQQSDRYQQYPNGSAGQQQWPSSVRRTEPPYPSTESSSAATTGSQAVVMVATGKKRKRLQRACVACHKAKRRCDGGLPCSNCDFSGRTCAYSDSQGKAVPPTKRTLRPSEAALQEQQQQQQQQQQQHQQVLPSPVQQHHQYAAAPPHQPHVHEPVAAPSAHHRHMYAQQPQQHREQYLHHHHQGPVRHSYGHEQSAHALASATPAMHNGKRSLSASSSSSPRSPTSPATSGSSRRRASEPNPEVRRELLLIFFSKVQPWSCVVDEISLLRDLSSMSASPAILFAIYALSARYAERNNCVDLRYARLVDEVGNGASYATEARKVLQSEDPTSGVSALDGNLTLDTRQALCLLACFEFENGRHERAASYVQLCSKHVSSLSSKTTMRSMESKQQAQLSERLTTILAVLDLCISLSCGRAPILRAWELDVAVESIRRTTARSSHNVGAATGQDQTDLALSHLLMITSILSNALDIHRRAKCAAISAHSITATANDETHRNVQACERHLQDWADRLPARLRFDEENLFAASKALQVHHHDAFAPTHASDKTGPWSSHFALSWCAMHLFAESVTLVLRDASNSKMPLAAAQNMIMMLERMNVRAIAGPVVALAIAVLKSSSKASQTRESEDAAWTELYSAASELQHEARIATISIREATAWLGMGRAGTALSPLPSSALLTGGHYRSTWGASMPPRRAVSANGEVDDNEPKSAASSSFSASSFSKPETSDRAASVSPRQSSSFLGGSVNGAIAMPPLKSRQSSSSSTTDSSSSAMTLPASHLYHHAPLNSGSKTGASTMLPPLRSFSPSESGHRDWRPESTAETRHRAATLTSPRALLEQSRA